MFNKKLKSIIEYRIGLEVESIGKRIKGLVTRIENLEEANEELAFKVENKPKFEAGDKVGDVLVLKGKYQKEVKPPFLSGVRPLGFPIFNESSPLWTYYCFNMATKETLSMSETQLSELKFYSENNPPQKKGK